MNRINDYHESCTSFTGHTQTNKPHWDRRLLPIGVIIAISYALVIEYLSCLEHPSGPLSSGLRLVALDGVADALTASIKAFISFAKEYVALGALLKILGLHQKVWVKKDGSVPNCCVKPQVKISITCFARPAALI